MSRRTMLEQEIYEQLLDQGIDEFSADLIAHEQAEGLEPDVSEEADRG